jgi:hypothetical protein
MSQEEIAHRAELNERKPVKEFFLRETNQADASLVNHTGMEPTAPTNGGRVFRRGCNRVQGATALLAFTATSAL